jgi:protein ImuB
MHRRYVSIWFRSLVTDWLVRRQPELTEVPFVLTQVLKGKVIVCTMNGIAASGGIYQGQSLADARALLPTIEAFDEKPDLPQKLLIGIGEWAIKFTPIVHIAMPDTIILDVTGCAHLWGGERPYLKDIITKIRSFGYDARGAMADTVGSAWAVARYGKNKPIIQPGEQRQAILQLPLAALRLEYDVLDCLSRLGFRVVNDIINMPRPVLNRRFGKRLTWRLDQALGALPEALTPIRLIEPYSERRAFPEGVVALEGISAALLHLLRKLCSRLDQEQKGVRTLRLQCHRVDGKIEEIAIGTSRPSRRPEHLYKLFEEKVGTIEPALGIELFILDATAVEDMTPSQEALLDRAHGMKDDAIPELIDQLANRLGKGRIARFIPQERHWPEKSIKAVTVDALLAAPWPQDKIRPVRLLSKPEFIEVIAPVPDYPPVMFRYKGKTHRIKKADGPERIEREWWLDKGLPRDYYRVEDEAGYRYWLFRSGHYRADEPSKWFLHGFFA